MINTDDNQRKGTNWFSLFIEKNIAIYLDSFVTEYIPQEELNKVKDEFVTHNMFRIQSDHFIMCECYCYKVIHKYFKDKYDKRIRRS